MSYAKRVADGMAYLDEHEPGWLDVIDLDILNLESVCGCVLGQLATRKAGPVVRDEGWSWRAITEILGVRFGLGVKGAPGDAQLGFNLYGRPTSRRFANLTAEWKRQITARRTLGG